MPVRPGRVSRVVAPPSYHVGHEAHFGQVASQFLDYVARGALPGWEVPNMIAKYFTTTEAYRLSRAHVEFQPKRLREVK